MDNNTFIKKKIKTLSDETITNMISQRKVYTGSSLKKFLLDEQKKRKKLTESEE
tara:strand:- start:410 stop:571 length:162 start_codon:yes stop_codon:yes gene_type:complete